MAYKFPENFLWGAGTSAYQVEGGNWNSDWWEFEHTPGSPIVEPSGDACDHYHKYPADIALLAGLGFNSYRFGIEWARIEPEEGEYSLVALDHYLDVCEVCRKNGLEPIITFNHCSLPRWIAHRGGYLWEGFPDSFARYCHKAATHLKEHLGLVATLNEPELCANLGMRYGNFPRLAFQDMENSLAAKQALKVLQKAHLAGREAIRSAAPNAQVGLTLAIQEWGGFEGDQEELSNHPLVYEWEGRFYEATRGDDFLGVQVYTRMFVPPISGNKNLDGNQVDTYQGLQSYFNYPEGTRRTMMGYEYRPQAVGGAIRRAHALTNLPIIVTENGLATEDDTERLSFISGALESLQSCIQDGLPVKGYIHWSLLDNFEWNQGYRMKFGLIAVDRKTLKRTVKPSAKFLGEIARSNYLP
jgi:beta-glucosidase